MKRPETKKETKEEFDKFCQMYAKNSKVQVVYPGTEKLIEIPNVGTIRTLKMASGTSYVIKNNGQLVRMDEKFYSELTRQIERAKLLKEEQEENGENELPSDESGSIVESDEATSNPES